MDTIFEGLQEQSRLKLTSELRRFIEVDHEAVKIGDPENSEAIRVVRPKFNKEIFPNAAVRKGVYSRWKPPLVDEDWHAICHIHEGVQ